MRSHILAAGTCLFALVGCAQLDYAMTEYGGIKPLQFAYSGKTWRIFDRPADGRLMITPTVGDAAAAGAVEGMTLGLSGNASGSEGVFHSAALAYLKTRSKSCKIYNGALVINPQWEFFYEC